MRLSAARSRRINVRLALNSLVSDINDRVHDSEFLSKRYRCNNLYDLSWYSVELIANLKTILALIFSIGKRGCIYV